MHTGCMCVERSCCANAVLCLGEDNNFNNIGFDRLAPELAATSERAQAPKFPHSRKRTHNHKQSEFDELASELGNGHERNAAFCFAFDEPLSHLIYAAADIVVVSCVRVLCNLSMSKWFDHVGCLAVVAPHAPCTPGSSLPGKRPSPPPPPHSITLPGSLHV